MSLTSSDIHEGISRAEIDAAIARPAETELLYDRPRQDPKVVRVAGPFTVESLSPHRVVADGPEDLVSPTDVPGEESGPLRDHDPRQSPPSRRPEHRHGRATGVTTLDPFPGRWIQARGEYLENEQPKRVAVAIGLEYGTVGPEPVREAAKEAIGLLRPAARVRLRLRRHGRRGALDALALGQRHREAEPVEVAPRRKTSTSSSRASARPSPTRIVSRSWTCSHRASVRPVPSSRGRPRR